MYFVVDYFLILFSFHFISGSALVASSVLKCMSKIADDDEELELSNDLLDHAK